MCMNTPLVSVIIPVYKVEKYIRQALDSVINQTYRNLQIILIDDGSPDQCGEICDEYARRDNRFLVIHQRNAGASAARNVGINKATGEWITFVDPDDWLDLNACREAVEYALKTNADMIFYDYDNIFDGYTMITRNLRSEEDNLIYKQLNNEKTWKIFMSNGSLVALLIRRKCFDAGARYHEGIMNFEDILLRETLYRYIQSFAYIPKVLYHRRIRRDSACHNSKLLFEVIDSVNIFYEEIMFMEKDYDYPCNFLRMNNSLYISQLNKILLYAKELYPYREVKHLVMEYMNSANFLKACSDYDVKLVSKISRIFLWFQKLGLMPVHLLYFMKVLYDIICGVSFRIREKFIRPKHNSKLGG